MNYLQPYKIFEQIKKTIVSSEKTKKMEELIAKYRKDNQPAEKEKEEEKTPKTGPFKKGEMVYLNGIYGAVVKKFNGKRCKIIGKTEEREDCFDLYCADLPGGKDEVNIKGMPSNYMFRGKPKEIIDTPPAKVKPRATKKPVKK
jgi:hypothetical protein